MKSDGDKLYIKIIDLDEIYNCVVQSSFIWSHLDAQIIDKCSRSKIYFCIWSLWQLFEHQDSFEWNNFELQSCTSCWFLQFLYKVYLHTSLYKLIIIFWWCVVQCSDQNLNFRSEICIDYLSIKMAPNEKKLNYTVVDLVKIYNFYIKFISIRFHIN